MKRSIKEAIKHISFLEQQILSILQDERQNSYVEYQNEVDREPSNYDMNEVSNKIEVLQSEVLKVRKAINLANQETLVGIDDLSISDALIRVAQLTKNANRFQELANFKQKMRRTSYGDTVEYIERLYDVKLAQEKHLECLQQIYALQTAIDKANILTEIDI